MISNEDIKKLSVLARLEVSEEELGSMTKEINGILEYVGMIDSAIAGNENIPEPEIYTNLREDSDANETSLQTETLLQSAPKREENFVKVKQVL